MLDIVSSEILVALHHVYKLLMPYPTYPISCPDTAFRSIIRWYLTQIPRHYLAIVYPDPGTNGISPDGGVLRLGYNYAEQGSQ